MRKAIQKLLLCAGVATFLMVGASCKGEKAAKEMESLATKACECQDKECATKVVTDLAKFMKANKETKGSDKQVKRVTEAFGKAMKCLSDKGIPATEFAKITQGM